MCMSIKNILNISLEEIQPDLTCEICSSNPKFYERRKTKITTQIQTVSYLINMEFKFFHKYKNISQLLSVKILFLEHHACFKVVKNVGC